MKNIIKNNKVKIIDEKLTKEPAKTENVKTEVTLDKTPVLPCAAPVKAAPAASVEAKDAPIDEAIKATVVEEKPILEENTAKLSDETDSKRHHLMIDDIIYKAKHQRIKR